MLGVMRRVLPVGGGRPAQADVRAVVARLLTTYGQPRHGNPHRPLNDLFYIILSNKTTPGSARRVYRELRRAFTSWNQITPGDLDRLKQILEPAGLSNVRAVQIIGIVERLRQAFGSATLAPLKGMTPAEAETFLIDLPGVSLKVAKCVMMYTLGFQVLPVDNHVHRISVRLGWTARKRADQCHAELEALVPPPLRYGFHVAALAHGRAVCRPTNPRCDACVVRRFCAHSKGQPRP
jgi:endonuclease III